jgi:hypothetical protein
MSTVWPNWLPGLAQRSEIENADDHRLTAGQSRPTEIDLAALQTGKPMTDA